MVDTAPSPGREHSFGNMGGEGGDHGYAGKAAPRLLWSGKQGVRPGRGPGDPTRGRCPEPLRNGSCLPPLLQVLGPRSEAGHPLTATQSLVLSPGVGVSVRW